jgi:5-methylcytosine-specific restriction enzyme A
MRALVLAEEPLCRDCLGHGETKLSTEVDHIIPMEAGGEPLARWNLQALCHACHSRKTIREAGLARGQGQARS